MIRAKGRERKTTADVFAWPYILALIYNFAPEAVAQTVPLPPLTPPAEFRAMDKPNDNGAAIILTWKKMPHDSPQVLFEVLASDDPADLRRRLDGLLELGVIDTNRRDALLQELGLTDPEAKHFVSQLTFAAEKPAIGAPLAPPCTTRAAFPASFGFSRGNDRYYAIEFTRIVGRRDLVLYASTKWQRELVSAVTSRKLVHHVVDVDDPERIEVRTETFSEALERDRKYYFKLNVKRGNELVTTGEASAIPLDSWIAWHKTNVFVSMVVLSIIIMTFAKLAKRDPHKLFIRRIAGLEAVEEALGRAAEMGKPVFFCHGPGDLSSVVTISAINLLGKIAERVAEYGTELKVTCLDYLVMQVSQEMVRDAFTRVGRADAYRDDNVMFVTGDTFAYSAAVGGMMIREKAGTAFFFGRFGSESLLLSETGAVTKAIQIAGTDSFTQIPFFITTCDYTLIGEEMYAGSAYLSREPRLVGAVKGQDTVKAIIMTIIVTGTVLASVGSMWFAHLFWPLT
ncbi:MAG: DUF6754 domain-containing protein [Kiritimatiellia bacterium]